MSPQPTYKQSPHLDFLNSTMWGVGGSGGYIVAATPHHIACRRMLTYRNTQLCNIAAVRNKNDRMDAHDPGASSAAKARAAE